jgi:Nucleotidyltransferase domain
VDPGSTPSPLSPTGALAELAARAGVEFPHLNEARDLAAREIPAASAELAKATPSDVSVAMYGSWARGELTEGSDNDWAIVTPDGREDDEDVKALAEICQKRFNEDGKAPGKQDIFGVPFAWPKLAENIGLDEDDNTNLTRRMLTLLESVALTGPALDTCRQTILDRYLGWGVKDHRPPRFLLNDLIRYWRTICVDFEGKHRTSGGDDPKWVMRNAKLRTSRKVLFAGGLLPVLFCRLREEREISSFLTAQLAAQPVDRLAWAFLEANLIPEGARCLVAYDEWLAMLQDPSFRAAIARLRADSREDSSDFARVRVVGDRLHQGLTALLFESSLAPDATKYLVL